MRKRGKIKVFLASDHAGFKTKEKIKKNFSNDYEIEDIGTETYNKNDDYPDFAFKVAQKVVSSKNARGILVCGTGEGMAIAANKVRGIRAVAVSDEFSAKMSRLHNDSNILAVRGRNFPFEKMKKIISIWLKTPFSNEARHLRRIKKIEKYENQN